MVKKCEQTFFLEYEILPADKIIQVKKKKMLIFFIFYLTALIMELRHLLQNIYDCKLTTPQLSSIYLKIYINFDKTYILQETNIQFINLTYVALKLKIFLPWKLKLF